MHVSRQVGKTGFTTGSHRDTPTYFYILPLVVNCVFAYTISVMDVILLAVNIVYVYVHRHARTHTYINIRVFFSLAAGNGL